MTLPWILAGVVALVAWLPSLEPGPAADRVRRGVAGAAGAAACLIAGPAASGVLALATLLHGLGCGTRTGGVALGAAAAAHAATGLALWAGQGEIALATSLLAVAVRSGPAPLHLGTAALAHRAPAVLVEVGATGVAAAFLHLRDVLPAAPEAARALAVPVGVWGATAAALSGLASLSRPSLRGLWSSSVSVHGGMAIAALGAAGQGHLAGAVFVAVAFALALGGFGLLLAAIEARTGPVALRAGGGRSGPFPRLTWAFAFFAAAGVALPGTVGFAADDLLLHALWAESPAACALVLAASALLAVGLLRGFGAAFLGPPSRRFVADDLSPREGAWVAALAAALVGFGVRPAWLLGPTLAFFAGG